MLLSTYISFYCCIYHPTLRHLKREHDLYQNINHHSFYVNKFRISPFTMRTSTRAGNATFRELINHTHTESSDKVPLTQTETLRSLGHKHTPSNVAESERGPELSDSSACCQPLPTRSLHCNPGKITGRIRGASGMHLSVSILTVFLRLFFPRFP